VSSASTSRQLRAAAYPVLTLRSGFAPSLQGGVNLQGKEPFPNARSDSPLPVGEGLGVGPSRLVEVVFQHAAGLGMPQLADGALLDLAHALARHFELLAHLFERVIVVVNQAEAQLNHLALA
jgi:hypothetical protein